MVISVADKTAKHRDVADRSPAWAESDGGFGSAMMQGEREEKEQKSPPIHATWDNVFMFSRAGAYHGKGAQAAEDTERRSTSAIDVDRVPLCRRPHIPSLCIAPLVNLPSSAFLSVLSCQPLLATSSLAVARDKTNLQITPSNPLDRPSGRRIIRDGALGSPRSCKRRRVCFTNYLECKAR